MSENEEPRAWTHGAGVVVKALDGLSFRGASQTDGSRPNWKRLFVSFHCDTLPVFSYGPER